MSGRKRILGFGSGGGSGLQWLIDAMHTGLLDADICALVSNYNDGGVRKIADESGIPFEWMDPSRGFAASEYVRLTNLYQPNLTTLSGWLKPVSGLDSRYTINIHPALLPQFGGKGMYGHFAHEAVKRAFEAGEITHTEVCMHFATMFDVRSQKDEYDKGPVFFRMPVGLRPYDTADTIGRRVNEVEHGWQAFITNLVVQGQITWDGFNPESLKVPDWYLMNQLIGISGCEKGKTL